MYLHDYESIRQAKERLNTYFLLQRATVSQVIEQENCGGSLLRRKNLTGVKGGGLLSLLAKKKADDSKSLSQPKELLISVQTKGRFQ